MKEYIERSAVKDEILSWAVCINHPELLSKEDTMHCVDSLPAADVAPVRHGDGRNTMGPIKGSTTVPSAKGKLSITRKMER